MKLDRYSLVVFDIVWLSQIIVEGVVAGALQKMRKVHTRDSQTTPTPKSLDFKMEYDDVLLNQPVVFDNVSVLHNSEQL
jgi:hypothetical protein